MPKQTDHLTPREAASILGITQDAVRKLIKLRKLAGRKYDGCHYRITRESLSAWMTRKERKGE